MTHSTVNYEWTILIRQTHVAWNENFLNDFIYAKDPLEEKNHSAHY